MTIQEYEEKLLQLIDDGIDTATDDELFAGGYLRGHISLAAADCEEIKIKSLDIFKNKLSSCLVTSKHELNPYDFLLVEKLLADLLAKLDD